MSELGRALTVAMLIDVSDEEVVRRLGGRRTCVKEGHIFHVEFDPPKNEGICDICGARLEIRDDDKPEVIRNRLEHLPREDRAAGRLLRGARDPARGWTARASPTRSTTGSARCSRRSRWKRSSRELYRVIIKKTPEQIEQMAASGAIQARCLRMLRSKCQPGRHHRRAR